MDNKKDKGFTLVELLIVIVILGILATITVFAVRGITDQGQKSSCQADRKTMETAVEAWYAQNGTATNPTETGLVASKLLVTESVNYEIAPVTVGTPADGVKVVASAAPAKCVGL